LYELHAQKMLSVCRYYISDLQEAEDVMIGSFCKAFQKLKTFSNEGNFQSWLRRIMVNECMFYHRKRKFHFTTDNFEENTMSFDDKIIENYDVDHLQLLIDNLPKGYKIVFVLYAIEGYKHQEIATMSNISESTSKSKLYRVTRVLQSKLECNKIKGNGTR
jgi:RNA polymerase sigma factor (sigma-70 family)